MKTVKCKKCGHEHSCSRLAPKEAAFIRWAKEKKGENQGDVTGGHSRTGGAGTDRILQVPVPDSGKPKVRRGFKTEETPGPSRTETPRQAPETPVAPTLDTDVDQAKEAQMKAFIERMERKR